jgi:hypothetical protein
VAGVGLAEHDRRRLNLGRRRAGFHPARLDHREGAGVGEGLRQATGRLFGDNEQRTLQRHDGMKTATPGRHPAAT